MQEFQKVHLMQFSALFDMADFNLTSLAFFVQQTLVHNKA